MLITSKSPKYFYRPLLTVGPLSLAPNELKLHGLIMSLNSDRNKIENIFIIIFVLVKEKFCFTKAIKLQKHMIRRQLFSKKVSIQQSHK